MNETRTYTAEWTGTYPSKDGIVIGPSPISLDYGQINEDLSNAKILTITYSSKQDDED